MSRIAAVVRMVAFMTTLRFAAARSKASLAPSVDSPVAYRSRHTLIQLVAASTKIVAPQMRAQVGDHVSCGTKPGCAETSRSVQTFSPGTSNLGFLICSAINVGRRTLVPPRPAMRLPKYARRIGRQVVTQLQKTLRQHTKLAQAQHSRER